MIIRLAGRLACVAPIGQTALLTALSRAKVTVTDSGGIQEETTYMGIPCFTLRENTERPVTITQGTNKMTDALSAAALIKNLESADSRAKPLPALLLSPFPLLYKPGIPLVTLQFYTLYSTRRLMK